MSRKKKLQKKIAVAVSVVNILNVCAPMVLPYVNMTRDLSARGGYMEPIQGGARFAAAGALADAVQAVMPEKTAEAAEQTIPDGDTKSAAWTENGGTMTEGDMQTINSGGTGTVENMSGTQTINSGGTGTVTTLNGTQIINDGGTGTIVTVSKGYQTINSGGTGTIVTMNGGNQYVSGSGTVTNLNSGGWQIVENGGTGTVTNLNSSGGQTIWDGGAGTITTMNGGRQKVNDGGTGTVTTMNGGYQHVNDGGTGTISTMSYGYQYVSSGGTGTVDTMTVDTMSDGYQYVSSGGTGTISTMSCGNQDVSGGGTVITMISGYQDVKVGGTGTVTTMNDGGQRVRVGGTGTVTTMNGGSQYICSGGTGTVTTINGGTQYISGGTGTVETIDGGTQTIEDGGTGTVSTMNGGTQTIEDGGTGTVSSLMSGATQIVSSGGTSLNTIVKSGGIIEEDGSGGKVTGASFEAGGIHRLASGATSTGLSIAGHILELGNGGTAINATVQDGGTAQVLAGGVMSGATVNNGGMQIVSGGTSFVTNLNSGGTQIVSGGTSYVTNLNSGSIVSVAFDVLHQKDSDTSPIHIGDGGTALLLDQGGTLVLDHKYQYGIRVSNGVVELQSGGKTWDATRGPTTILYGVFDGDNKQTASGLMIVHSGAEAGDTVISAGGMQIVEGQAGGDYESGGPSHVTYTNVSAGGTQIVKSGAIASRTYIHPQHGETVLVGGTQIVQGGATATSTHINSKTSAFEYESISVGGTQIVESGGTANTTYIHPKGTQIISGGGTANDTIINLNKTESNTTSNNFEYESISVGGTQIVQSGGMASNTYIYSKGTQIISNGGTAANTTIKGGGVQNVASGGTATDTTVDVGGTQIYQNAIISGGSNYVLGTASGGTIISGATQEVKGQAFDTVVNGTQIVNGGTATDTTINSGGTQIATEGGNLAGTQTVNFGGVASGGALTGTQTVYGTARATTISSGGTQYVSSGGTASGVTINYWGYQYVSSGGVASGTIINSEGYQYVYSGGTAVSTTISNGTQNVNSGGTAASTTIKGGIQNVFNGGTVVSTTISGGNQGVNSGGVASGTTISSGVQHVFSGGTTKELTIHSGGTQVCLEGARMSGVTLDGGTLSMNSMTKASGTLQGHGGVYDISVLSVGGADNFSSVVVSGGSIYTSNGFVIDNGGSMKVDNTGATSNTTVKSGGMMSVLGGGTANGATLDGGTLDMAREAKASGTVGGHGTVVYDGGSGQISLGGTDSFSSFTVSGGTLETQNGFQICSSGGITVNNGGTMIAGGDVMVQTSGTLTVSNGGSFSATNISAVNGGEVSMSGGVLQAAEDIAIDQALTNAYGSVSAGGTLTLSAGATQPGSGKQLNLSAGKDVNISGNVTVTDLSAGDNITAGGKAVNATNISAGGAIAAGSITATNVSASGSISATDNISADSISAGDTLSAGGDITAGTLALSTVPASGMAVSAGGNANITNLNVSGFDPGTSSALISAGGTVSEMTVNGKALTAGKTVYMNETVSQPKAGIEAAYTDLSFSLATDQRSLTYDAHNTYTNIAFSTIPWNADSAYYEAASTDRFTGDTAISAENLNFTFAEESQKAALASGSTMTLVANATGLPTGMDVNYGSGKTNVTQSIDYSVTNGVALTGMLTGTVATVAGVAVTSGATTSASVTSTAAAATATAGAIQYTVSSMTLDSVDLAGWDGATSSAMPGGWMATVNGVAVITDNMNLPELEAGASRDILTAPAGTFRDDRIAGANKYRKIAAFSDGLNGITLTGNEVTGVKAEDSGATLSYHALKKAVDTVDIGSVSFVKDTVLFDGSSAGYDYTGVTTLDTDNFDVVYASPDRVAAGDSMTLLKANATLQDMAEQTKKHSYSYTPVAGVTVDGNITGRLTTSKGIVTYTPFANQATKLTFSDVAWKDSGALMTRPANIVFAGADVDTSKINFTNVASLDANKKMTLVSDFGNSVGAITGTKYKVGTGLEGEGEASLSGSDLIFTTKTGANNLAAQEQTHNTVMGMEAGMALLSAGSEHVGSVMDSLGLASNTGVDGTSTAASIGGGASRYETGSHVNAHTWNAVVAVGRNNETKKGTLEYGLFGEYGKGSYTLHSAAGRGDGDTHHAGAGLLAKWTNRHNVYTEASIRLGRMSDTASDILHDAAGNGYGYDVHANYFGAHVGIGQLTNYRNGRRLDVYGKYFFARREGVSFDAGPDRYDLNSVSSSVLRIGARYGTTVKKWNWYGGLAFEYEFDGKSAGTVTNGGVSAAIRSASVRGSSVRCELGLRMDATKDNPWKADIAIYGYGGKHRGFGGNVSLMYTF